MKPADSIIEVKSDEDLSGSIRPVLIVDGVAYTEKVYVHPIAGTKSFRAAVFDETVNEIIMQHRFSNLSQNVQLLELNPSYALIQDESEIRQDFTIYQQDERTYLAYEFAFLVDDWKRPWSITEYTTEFIRILRDQNYTNVRLRRHFVKTLEEAEPEEDRISIVLPVDDPNVIIEKEVFEHSDLLNWLHKLTIAALITKIGSDSVVFQFDFPEEAKVACEQYLLYFVQFLKDLGVDATAELQHEAGQVLFAVTPTNKEEALDKIRTALSAYLNLPMNNITGGEGDITAQRLASNIYHLRSQLVLAHAVLQAKNATIQAQQFTILQQEHLLSGEVIVNSLRQVIPHPKEDDNEPVLDGMAEITKYAGKGFTVNLPEIYRRLRQLFNDE
jgi:hypothetical protein